MSMVANLSINDIGEKHCYCPVCGKWIEVSEIDFWEMLPNGDKEYSVYCSECELDFYAAESYDNPDWKPKEDEK